MCQHLEITLVKCIFEFTCFSDKYTTKQWAFIITISKLLLIAYLYLLYKLFLTYYFTKDIVDKTASFVARNGPEFESRIRQNELGNPKFNFLTQGDPYHKYYLLKVKDLREKAGKCLFKFVGIPNKY